MNGQNADTRTAGRAFTDRGGLLWLMAGLLVVASSVFDGGEQAKAADRMQLLNNGRGVQSLVRPEGSDRQGTALRMTGEMRYSHRDGLTLDGASVQLSHRTVLFPSPRNHGRIIDPSRLNGKHMTVFGRRNHGTIEAVLLILDPFQNGLSTGGSLGGFGANDQLRPEAYVPSSANPKVGELTGSAPK